MGRLNLSNYFLKRGKTMATSLGNCGIQGAGPGRPKGARNKFTIINSTPGRIRNYELRIRSPTQLTSYN